MILVQGHTSITNRRAGIHPSSLLLEPLLLTTPTSCKHSVVKYYSGHVPAGHCCPSSLTILPTPVPPGCGSMCRPLYTRKVDQISNSSSSSVGRFLIGGYFTALEADGQWLHSTTFQLMDKEVDTTWGSPGSSVVKNLPAKEGDTGSIPDPGRPHVPWSN